MPETRPKIKIGLSKMFPEGFDAHNPDDMMRLTRKIQEKAAPFFDDLLKKIPFKARFAACVILVVLFCCDAVYSKANPNQGKGITDYAAYNLPFHRVVVSEELGVRSEELLLLHSDIIG